MNSRMSFFKLGNDRIQEALIIALMLVFVFAVMFSDIAFNYKIGIGAIVFTIVFITSIATQALKQQQEEDKRRQK